MAEMKEKKIATGIDILVNVDRYEHIQISKYGEAKIEYSSDQERKDLEDQLTSETLEDGYRSLKIVTNILKGKTVEPCQAIVEKIIKKIPMWLEDGPEPNIANLPKITNNKRLAENSIKAEVATNQSEEINNLIDQPTNQVESTEPTLNDDLFESKEIKEEPVKETPKTDIESNFNDEIDFGDDDDLFA